MAVGESGFQLAGGAAASYERAMAVFMAPWSLDLVEHAQLRPSMDVLDVACGTGFAARRAQEVVGSTGRVVGVDINPQMVAMAQHVTGLEVREASADDTGLPTAAFDVVMCQQSLQFFPDPTAALREMKRVLRPGGRVVVSVWETFDSNPYFRSQLQFLGPHLSDDDAAAYRASDITTLGGVRGLRGLLEDAGFRDVAAECCTLLVDFPPMAEFVPLHLTALPMGSAFQTLSPAQQTEIVRRMGEELEAVDRDSAVVVPMLSWVATATTDQPRTHD